MLFLTFSNSLLIINGVNQRPVSKSMVANLTTVLYSTCFHYRCAISLILTSTVPWVTQLTIGFGQKQVRSFNDLVLLVFERPFVTGSPCTWSFRIVRVWRKSFCRHYFYLLQHQNCLATTDHATIGFYFSLAVLGSIGDKFGSINRRSYCSKSEFYDVFKQAKCLRLDFKRIFICLYLKSFDTRKTQVKRLVPSTFHRIIQR